MPMQCPDYFRRYHPAVAATLDGWADARPDVASMVNSDTADLFIGNRYRVLMRTEAREYRTEFGLGEDPAHVVTVLDAIYRGMFADHAATPLREKTSGPI